MESALARMWWVVASRGVLAILFGVVAFFWPVVFWRVVVYLFAAYALIDGSFALAAAATGRGTGGRWWALILQGLAGIAAGFVAILWPDITDVALLFVVAAWLLVTGVLAVAAAIRLRRYIRGEWALALGGVLSILLGLAMAIWPVAGLLAVAWWVGAFSVAYGILLLTLAVRLRALALETSRPEAAPSRRVAFGRP